MNLFGNSLKFTTVCVTFNNPGLMLMYNYLQDGYVHVMLRQLPPVPGQPENTMKVELSVIDTGKVCHA